MEEVRVLGRFVTLDDRGNIKDINAGNDDTGLDIFCENIDGTEIDGLRFDAKKQDGVKVEITISGEDVSDQFHPNDVTRIGMPVMQIRSKNPDGKKTALALNKFLFRVNKLLEKEPFNHERKMKANTILIKEILN
ncbi:MAG: hypothetical protein ABIF08_02010 [Nanoarchaeota archaeon]